MKRYIVYDKETGGFQEFEIRDLLIGVGLLVLSIIGIIILA